VNQQLQPFALDATVSNWHQVDALLALLAAIRYMHKAHSVFGNEVEGMIIV
jgi:hypothetical protein